MFTIEEGFSYMKYFVSSDIHGFFSLWQKALKEAGYDENNKNHKIIICGDLFDRGNEAKELLNYLTLNKDKIIIIKGNHEDLFLECLEQIEFQCVGAHHVRNMTLNTISQLSGISEKDLIYGTFDFAKLKESLKPYFNLSKNFVDYFEIKGKTKNFIFVHGWIPVLSQNIYKEPKPYNCSYNKDWRNATQRQWMMARWYNGMDMNHFQVQADNEVVFCGHWHTSYGHSKYENRGEELGPTACFKPYMANGIVALDACTAYTKKVNVVVFDDKTQKLENLAGVER